MTRARALGPGLSAALVFALFVVGGLVASVAPISSAAHPALAPIGPRSGPAAPSTLSALAAPAAATQGSFSLHPAPGGTYHLGAVAPHWGSSNFFSDLSVSFSVPYSSGPPNFPTVPYTGNISEYATGFWLNVSTNVNLSLVFATIWGTQWPVQGSPPQGITNFDPANPTPVPFYISPSDRTHADLFFNCYRFFWPGSTLMFNVTAVAASALPSVVNSANAVSVPFDWAGGIVDYPTWIVTVNGAWASPQFTSDIHVSTIPSALGKVRYDPNPTQAVQVVLTSFNQSGGPAGPIPAALINFTIIRNGSAVSYSESFTPYNHTQLELTAPIGPFAGAELTFNITAWLPWEGSAGGIDRIYSPPYYLNWTGQGGWWYPRASLESNLVLTTSPDVTSHPLNGSLPTGTAVNVSIHEPIQNVTIHSAEIDYRLVDRGVARVGALNMSPAGPNTTFAILPGLPAGASISFRVVAKDIYLDPVASDNYSYSESGAPANPGSGSQGVFFLEVFDASTGGYLPSFPFTIANGTWSTQGTASPLGIAAPLASGTNNLLLLSFGTYVVSVVAYGSTMTATVNVVSATPFTVVFYASASPVPVNAWAPAPTSVLVAGGIGLVAAGLASLPLLRWFRERRKKAEAEQRRITL